MVFEVHLKLFFNAFKNIFDVKNIKLFIFLVIFDLLILKIKKYIF